MSIHSYDINIIRERGISIDIIIYIWVVYTEKLCITYTYNRAYIKHVILPFEMIEEGREARE